MLQRIIRCYGANRRTVCSNGVKTIYMVEDVSPHDADHADNIRRLADVLLVEYGADAKVVAARQIEAATGDARETWIAIAALISSDAPRP